MILIKKMGYLVSLLLVFFKGGNVLRIGVGEASNDNMCLVVEFSTPIAYQGLLHRLP